MDTNENTNNTSEADFKETVSQGTSFVENLREDLREHKSLQNVKDINDLANQFVNAQKKIGERVSEPEVGDEYFNFYNKLGRPESFDKYEFDIPEDLNLKELGISEDTIKEKYAKSFHEAGLTKKQAKLMAEKNFENLKEQITLNSQKKEDSNKEFLKLAHESFGGEDGWAKASAEVKAFLINNVPKEIRADFANLDNKSALTVIKSVKTALDSINEQDEPINNGGGDNGSIGISKYDVQKRMREIQDDPDYRNYRSPRYEDLQKEFSGLVKKKHNLK